MKEATFSVSRVLYQVVLPSISDWRTSRLPCLRFSDHLLARALERGLRITQSRGGGAYKEKVTCADCEGWKNKLLRNNYDVLWYILFTYD